MKYPVVFFGLVLALVLMMVNVAEGDGGRRRGLGRLRLGRSRGGADEGNVPQTCGSFGRMASNSGYDVDSLTNHFDNMGVNSGSSGSSSSYHDDTSTSGREHEPPMTKRQYKEQMQFLQNQKMAVQAQFDALADAERVLQKLIQDPTKWSQGREKIDNAYATNQQTLKIIKKEFEKLKARKPE
ncbi:uncharacterized protein LOC116339268 isoform X2 [Contarinia nasturtii]|nr:uncharacterized protein LOC116339268 isoform X2 [Contarinia nasturtii]